MLVLSVVTYALSRCALPLRSSLHIAEEADHAPHALHQVVQPSPRDMQFLLDPRRPCTERRVLRDAVAVHAERGTQQRLRGLQEASRPCLRTTAAAPGLHQRPANKHSY